MGGGVKHTGAGAAAWLRDNPDVFPLLRAEVDAREQVGIATYPQPLRLWSLRMSEQDALEEAIDLSVYLTQLRERRRAEGWGRELWLCCALVALTYTGVRIDINHDICLTFAAAVARRETYRSYAKIAALWFCNGVALGVLAAVLLGWAR